MDKWDRRFFNLATTAKLWSKDPNCKVGAVIVHPDIRQFSMGYNGLPAGIEDKPEILEDKELKNKLTVHAEVNAILNARCKVEGWTMYCTKAPCIDCATTLIQAGIAQLNCPEPNKSSSWYDENIIAMDLLKQAQIDVYFVRDGLLLEY